MNERKQAKGYTAEFKESAVKLAVESKRPLTQTARELGVNKDTLYGWVRQCHGKLQPSAESVNTEHVYEELKSSITGGGSIRPSVTGLPSSSNNCIEKLPDFVSGKLLPDQCGGRGWARRGAKKEQLAAYVGAKR